jgi:hypothetical protein
LLGAQPLEASGLVNRQIQELFDDLVGGCEQY